MYIKFKNRQSYSSVGEFIGNGDTVKKSKDMIAIKVRKMVISGGGEVEGSCDGK